MAVERKTLRNRMADLMKRRDTVEVLESRDASDFIYDPVNKDAVLDVLFEMNEEDILEREVFADLAEVNYTTSVEDGDNDDLWL